MDRLAIHNKSGRCLRPQNIKQLLMLICILTILVITLSACIKMQKSVYPEKFADNTFFELVADKAEYSSTVTQIGCTIYNYSDDEVIFGAAYALEVFQNGAWYSVPFKGVHYKTQPTWPAIAYMLPAHDNKPDVIIDLTQHEEVKPGEYRIIKEISLRSGEQARYVLAACFTIQ